MLLAPRFALWPALSIGLLVGCVASDAPPPSPGFNTGGMGGAGGAGGQGGQGNGGGQAGQTGSSGTSGQGGQGAGAGGVSAAGAGAGGASGGASGGQAGAGQGGGGGQTPAGTCATMFSTTLPAGAQNPRVAGEWNDFDLATATPLKVGGDGKATGTVALPPGLHGYKLIVDQGGKTEWILDPDQGRRKYVGGIENSAIKVHDCALPSLQVASSQAARTAAGQGTYTAKLTFTPGAAGVAADLTKFSVTVGSGEQVAPLSAAGFDIDAQGTVNLHLSGLADGKHRVTVVPVDQSGQKGEPVRLPFWIEAEDFKWDDALVYMVMTDRLRDGDPSNNGPKVPGAESLGDYQGGDLEGLRQVIADGTLDALGVRAIWLTPFQTNPAGGYKAADGVHVVTGYHGYWPIKAREVDPRLGGAAALHAMVAEAHKHGIRILQDYVVNHVHEEHEYFKAHPDWFRTNCTCGTDGCGWTEKALECLFASYLPDINHTVPEANKQFVDDAVYWLDEFDLDGLRVDAVKHVEEIATRNLSTEVHEQFQKAGTHYFLMGETAMGWGDCDDPCNDENYGTISRYIGPNGLDGQFDFVLYHGVSYRTFASQEKGMLHADYWFDHGQKKWPAGAIMTPYIGSHDTPRFVTLADPPNAAKAGNQWQDVSQAPGNNDPLLRNQVAMAWLLGLPGAPLLYYGDEYGQWGGSDPNNRRMWRPESELSSDEKSMLAFTKKLGQARRKLPGLRRGAYVPYGQLVDLDQVGAQTKEDVLVFGRKGAGNAVAIVGVNRSGTTQAINAQAQQALGIAPGTKLTDAMSGESVTVNGSGKVSVVVPAHGAVILAP